MAVVSNAGVDSLLCWCHIIQGERKVCCCIPQKLISSEQPGNPRRRVAVHLTMERNWSALHDLWGYIYPHGSGCIWKTGVKYNIPGVVCVRKTRKLMKLPLAMLLFFPRLVKISDRYGTVITVVLSLATAGYSSHPGSRGSRSRPPRIARRGATGLSRKARDEGTLNPPERASHQPDKVKVCGTSIATPPNLCTSPGVVCKWPHGGFSVGACRWCQGRDGSVWAAGLPGGCHQACLPGRGAVLPLWEPGKTRSHCPWAANLLQYRRCNHLRQLHQFLPRVDAHDCPESAAAAATNTSP